MADPNIKIRIATEAELSGAEKAEKAIKDIGAEAEKSESKLDRMFREAEANLSAYESKAAAGKSSPGLPGQGGGKLSPIAAGATIAGLVAATAAVRKLISEFAEGVSRASELGSELEKLDEAGRKAAVDALGPLGEIISQTAPEFAAQLTFGGLRPGWITSPRPQAHALRRRYDSSLRNSPR